VTVTASEVFAFLDRHRTGEIERHVISSAYFGVLRRSTRAIATKLSEGDDDDGRDLCERLRVLLSEWLTVPVPFDQAITASLQFLGDPQAVETRWGREFRAEYETALEAAEIVALDDNPVRVRIRTLIREVRAQGQTFRIYCHRRARTHFESIVTAPDDLPLAPECFLSSVVEYREAPPFDVLIKVGPLRSRGWGSAPDALLNAPRFARLVQVVWIGCADEEDFGFDPVAAPAPAVGGGADQVAAGLRATWTTQIVSIGDDPHDATGAGSIDELKLFQRQGSGAEMRRATLIQIDDEHGILYPPQSQVASFDAATPGEASIGYRLPGETLGEGMFVLWAFLGDADLGGLQAGDGHYSRIWKERLRDELRRDAAGLVRRLSEAGIALQHLSSRVRRWWRPPSTVIHAPQQRRHFEILVSVLGIDHDATASSSVRRRPWWQYAWNEIGQSRGEAIQTGMQEHEIVDEQLFAILVELLPEIRSNAAAHEPFQIEIPPGRPLAGAVRFYPVRNIEEGFLVPDTVLKTVCDLDTIEQWRV
jgi:hypothetical protein